MKDLKKLGSEIYSSLIKNIGKLIEYEKLRVRLISTIETVIKKFPTVEELRENIGTGEVYHFTHRCQGLIRVLMEFKKMKEKHQKRFGDQKSKIDLELENRLFDLLFILYSYSTLEGGN